jgi:anti-anti-sigma factor
VQVNRTAAGVASVEVAGDIDMATADHLNASITEATAGDQVNEVVIDLAGVTFCDSTGLQTLVNAHRSCQERQIRLVLRGPDDRLRMLLKIAGLADHFTVEP